MSLDPQIRQFEQELDEALAARPSCRRGGPNTIFSAAHIAELAFTTGGKVGDDYVHGLQMIAPRAVGGDPAVEVPSNEILEDLQFGAHYWRLRELLYYSYNAPGSIDWEFGEDEVRIRYADPSLPRQFFIATNNVFLESRRVFQGREEPAQIRELLLGAPESAVSAAGERALALLEDEAATKLSAYFNLFEPGFDAPLEEHSFRELMEVCRLVLAKALWHRYHTEVNSSRGAVLIDLDELAESLADASDLLDPKATRWALRFMSYGADSHERGEDRVYFSLYRLPADERVLLLPHHFCTWESVVSLMRLIALRDPGAYLRHFSGPIGSGLTRRLTAAFEAAGFECRRDVSLRRFGAELPDIDLLVVSPDIGTVVTSAVESQNVATAFWQRGGDLLDQPGEVGVILAGDQLLRRAGLVGSDARDSILDGIHDELASMVGGLATQRAMGGRANPDVELARPAHLRVLQEALARGLDRVLDLLRRALGVPRSELRSKRPCSLASD